MQTMAGLHIFWEFLLFGRADIMKLITLSGITSNGTSMNVNNDDGSNIDDDISESNTV